MVSADLFASDQDYALLLQALRRHDEEHAAVFFWREELVRQLWQMFYKLHHQEGAQVWALPQWQRLRRLEGHRSEVMSAFSADGRRIITG